MPKRLQVGVKCVIVNGNKALVLRCKSHLGLTSTYWDLPGGRIDGNETLDQTLERELKEEVLNLGRYRVGSLLHAWRSPYDFKDGSGLVFIYYRVNARLNEVELSDEHSEYRWLTKEQLPVLVKDSTIEFPKGNQDAIRLALS